MVAEKVPSAFNEMALEVSMVCGRRALDVGAFGGTTDAEGGRDRCLRMRLERHAEKESHDGDEVLAEDHDEEESYRV